MQQQNVWIKITTSHLSYELGLNGEKKLQWKLCIMKNGHSEDDTFHALLVKLKFQSKCSTF